MHNHISLSCGSKLNLNSHGCLHYLMKHYECLDFGSGMAVSISLSKRHMRQRLNRGRGVKAIFRINRSLAVLNCLR